MFGLDCEMVQTVCGNEIARITFVDELGCVILDKLVKPTNKIINYLTKYSGITEKQLASVDTTLADIQKELSIILPPDAILVGHSLNFDLRALKIFHPYIIDTAVVFNLKGRRCFKSKLKVCSKVILGRDIQNNDEGHSSAEDAKASLDLVLMKLSKGTSFGDVLAGWNSPQISGDSPSPSKRLCDQSERSVSSFSDLEKLLKQPLTYLKENDKNHVKILRDELFTGKNGQNSYSHLAFDFLQKSDINFCLWPNLKSETEDVEENRLQDSLQPSLTLKPKKKYAEVLAKMADSNRLIVANFKSEKTEMQEKQEDYRRFAKKYFESLSGINMIILIAGGSEKSAEDGEYTTCNLHMAVKESKTPKSLIENPL